MAKLRSSYAKIVNDAAPPAEKPRGKFDALAQWILAKTDAWRTWRDSNYSADWDSYERLWRGKWSAEERQRASERSKIVTPALSEAVENGAAEIEEAVFGRGSDFFDIETDEELFEEPEQGAVPMGGAPMMLPGALPPDISALPPGALPPDISSLPPGALPPDISSLPPGALPPDISVLPPGAGPQMPMGALPPGAMPPFPMRSAAVTAAVQRTMDPLDAVEITRASLRDDLQRSDFAANCTEIILYSAVFGTGFGEIVMVEQTRKRPTADGLGSIDEKFDVPVLRAVSPRNVLIDPNAKKIEDCLGIAIEEEVSKHLLLQQQKAGLLEQDVDLCPASAEIDDGLSGDLEAKSRYDQDKVHVIRWYGLVPTKLLFPEDNERKDEDVNPVYLTPEEAEDGDYTEAIVIITNKRDVVKAVTNPAPKADRPVVYFPWDTVPGRLHGRGLCEKGYNSQKILDTEVRARLDGLALTWAPMFGLDATRIPRGMKFQIVPGGSILTNGDPETVLRPIKMGQLDPNHWQNMQSLQAMVAQATGSIDATQLANNVGQARSGAVSMAMAPVIKRYKRTLVRFFDLFLMPTLDKIVSRSQQSMPDRYPAVSVKLRPASTMGIMQREYETAQLTSLLASLPPGTPEHRAILMGIVSNTSIPNREMVLKLISGAEERDAKMAQAMAQAQQNPMLQAAQAQAVQVELQEKVANARKAEAEAMLAVEKAKAIKPQLQIDAMQMASKGLYAVPENQQADEFDRRLQLAQQVLELEKIKQKERDSIRNERIAQMQMMISAREKAADRQHKTRVELLKTAERGRRDQKDELSGVK